MISGRTLHFCPFLNVPACVGFVIKVQAIASVNRSIIKPLEPYHFPPFHRRDAMRRDSFRPPTRLASAAAHGRSRFRPGVLPRFPLFFAVVIEQIRRRRWRWRRLEGAPHFPRRAFGQLCFGGVGTGVAASTPALHRRRRESASSDHDAARSDFRRLSATSAADCATHAARPRWDDISRTTAATGLVANGAGGRARGR